MSTQTGKATGPLAGLRVIEMGTLLAGPFCGQLLGDLGAYIRTDTLLFSKYSLRLASMPHHKIRKLLGKVYSSDKGWTIC